MISEFLSKVNNVSAKLNEKSKKLADTAAQYADSEREKIFYETKEWLVEINKKEKAAGMKETTIFDFFKDKPQYQELLDLERGKE